MSKKLANINDKNQKKPDNNRVLGENKDFSELLEERERDNGIDESVKEIYEEEDGTIANSVNNKKNNMAKLEYREMEPWKKIAITFLVLLFVLAGASWAGFLIFNLGSRINPKDVKLEISGPTEVIAGKEVVYEIKYKNLGRVNLKDVEIRLDYSDNFIVLDTAPTRTETTDEKSASANYALWGLEQVETKRSSRIEIKAKIIDKVDTEQKISLSINYRPENFSSTFNQEDEMTIKVKDTGINLTVEAPSTFNVDNEEEITITYVKQKESFISDFKIALEADEDFVIASEEGMNIWKIDNLSDKQEKLVIKGKYAKKPTDSKLKFIFAAPVEIKHDEQTKTEHYIFAEQELFPQVIEGEMQLTMSVNGSTINKAINAGAPLNYVIHYKNSSDADLKNVIIMAGVDSTVVDWDSLKNDYNGEVKTPSHEGGASNTITWTKEEISELGEIGPNEEGSFGFSLTVKSLDDLKDVPVKDYQVKSFLDYSIDGAIKFGQTHAIEIINKINSDLKFKNEVRYFDQSNVAVGSGPLPPKVGEKTTFRVYWTLTNSLHDLENIQVWTILPENISWEIDGSNKNMGGLNYDGESREVRWTIDSWDAVSEPGIAEFNISITPQESDKDKVMTLLNKAQAEAKDKETKDVINLDSKAKTTALEDDEVGKGYGKVE